jgi:uncharacterized Zn-binding protein involved in type VI secretion
MSFASTWGEGVAFAMPDVCKTPSPAGPIPIPYPNTAELAMANPGTCAETVNIVGMPAATTETMIMLTDGDDAGAAGGVVSSMFIGPAQFKLGSSVVMIEGMPAAFMGSMVAHNGVANANMPAGAQIAPSQEMVTVSP